MIGCLTETTTCVVAKQIVFIKIQVVSPKDFLKLNFDKIERFSFYLKIVKYRKQANMAQFL